MFAFTVITPPRPYTFRTKKTEIVDVFIVTQYGPKGWEGVRWDWKVRGGQLIPDKEPEQMGFTTMSKRPAFQVNGVLFSSLTQGVVSKYLIMCV
jgi:hypothetical protein